MARVLVIGYGNPLRSDDGFGWCAAQRLASALQYPDLELIARQQLTAELAETASHCELVIFVDAARDLRPREMRCERVAVDPNRPRQDSACFTHFLTPGSLLAWAATLYDAFPEAYCISVGGECFAEGDSLTPSMRAAFEPLLTQVRSLIDIVIGVVTPDSPTSG